MADKQLHIVCKDLPCQLDCGEAYDAYYILKYLSEAGVKIHVHCFGIADKSEKSLDAYCVEVHYYKLGSIWPSIKLQLPHGVASRASKQLVQRLLKDNHPILMLGTACTYFVHNGQLPKDRCFIRLNQLEHLYFKQVASVTKHWWKTQFLTREARLLEQYEAQIVAKATIITAATTDLEQVQDVFKKSISSNLALFLPWQDGFFVEEPGNYCLYHGNLSAPENEQAAIWLIENIFSKSEIPLVIAGKNPSAKLGYMAHQQNNTCLVPNPSTQQMQEIIRKAQVHILPSFNHTGTKAKLLHALYEGKHCIVNNSGVLGSGLEAYCTIANTTETMKSQINRLFTLEFTQEEYQHRLNYLQEHYNPTILAQELISLIWLQVGATTK